MKKSFAPTDMSIPYRLVGTYEYTQAVEKFNRLVQISSPEEIVVYDRVLNNRPEFSYFNGLNSAFGLLDEQGKLKLDRQKFEDKFIKKGIAWMSALAKVELSSTISLYGDAKQPFQTLPAAPFETVPYLNVLKDDVVAHMASLSKEPAFKEVLRPTHTADSLTMAYLRRIKLIKDMLHTLSNGGDQVVKAQIAPLQKELSYHEDKLVDRVHKDMYAVSSTSTTTSKGKYTESSGAVRVGTSDTTATRRAAIQDCANFVNQNGLGPAPRRTGNYPSGR